MKTGNLTQFECLEYGIFWKNNEIIKNWIRLFYDLKNHAELERFCLHEDNTLLGLHNSSEHTQALSITQG